MVAQLAADKAQLEDGGALCGALPPFAVGEEGGWGCRLVPEKALGDVRVDGEEVGEDGCGELRGKEEEVGGAGRRGWPGGR